MEKGNNKNKSRSRSNKKESSNSSLTIKNNSSLNFLELPNYQNSDLNLFNIPSYIIQSPEKKDKQQNENNENPNNKDEESERKTNHKRRKKNEVQCRNYECKLCKKTYLSYPALYTHCKLKHNTNNTSGRGRGRPKKDQNENVIEKSKYNPIDFTFFSKEDRTGNIEPKTGINECIDEAFKQLYFDIFKKRNEERNMKYYIKVEEHPFLNKFKKDEHNIFRNVMNLHQMTDIILIDYLNKMSMFCNDKYYTKLIIFVTLFRECVNIINKNKIDKKKNGDKEYTEINDAEDIPNYSNQFINDFLNPDDKGDDFGFSKDECIDLTQNLCYWMYENNFTSSKLSLINNEK